MYIPIFKNFLSIYSDPECFRNICLRNGNHFISKSNKYSLFYVGNPLIINQENNLTRQNKFDINYCIKKYEKTNIVNLANSLDGSFLICFIDENKKKIYIFNDRLGLYPFFYNYENQILYGSIHSDDVSSKVKPLELDKVSLAEFIRTGKISPGYSYFKNLKSFDYSDILIIDQKKGRISKKKYFYPEKYSFNKYSSINQSLFEMNNALKKNTEQIKKNFRKIYLFLSGGMDSRLIAMYFRGNDIKAISLNTFDNREKKITEKLSKKLKIDLNFLSLDYKQYLKYLDEIVLINGGMSDFTESHFYSENTIKKIKDLDLIISGCYFDYMFKGLPSNTKQVQIFGLKLPIKNKDSQKLYHYQEDLNINNSFKKKVDKRRKERFKNIKDLNLLEYSKSTPFSMHSDSVMRRTLIFFTNWQPFISSLDFIKVMLKTPIEDKINANLSRKMIFMKSKSISFIKNSNTGVPIYPIPFLDVLHRSFNFILEKIKNIILGKYKNPDKRKVHGSWVYSKEYISQPEFKSLFFKIDEQERKFIREIIGKDIWESSNFNKALKKSKPRLFSRIVTLAKWLELKRKNKLIDTNKGEFYNLFH